ncbi:MAG TPA: MFS transporter, partial [Phycisphaeraceae bacterium]
RQSYSYELINVLTYPAALALVEGGVVGVLAKKAFNVGPFQFATIMAAPMFANLTSFAWAYAARGRRKVAFINLLQVATLLTIAAIALLPTAEPGPMLLTALVVAARCLICGVVTIRSTVWRMNYPRHVRAQVTGRLALISSLFMAFAPLAGALLLDANPRGFRLLYLGSALFAMLGVWGFSHIRLRGERELIRYEGTPQASPQPHGLAAPIYEYDPRQPRRDTFWSVLRRDHLFRSYMLWQFISGVANMTGEAVIVYVIASLTANRPAEYLISIALSTVIPLMMAVLTLPRWARLLDRVHVAEFRCKQAWMWIVSQMGNWIGAALAAEMTGSFWLALAVLAGSRLFQGISRGGGMLAWNLGHNDFADRRLVALYMGIHVTLTGIRGAVAPFAGMALYLGWERIELPGLGVALPALEGLGYHVFGLTTLLAVMSEFGFRRLHQTIRNGRSQAVPTD